LREVLAGATGPVVMLAEKLARVDGIESAFIYGSFAARMLGDAGPTPHDVDVMLIEEPDVDAVNAHQCRRQPARGRRVRPAAARRAPDAR
jgi:hypothetical protein